MYGIVVLLFSYLIVPSFIATASLSEIDEQSTGASMEAKVMVAIVLKQIPKQKASSLLNFSFLYMAIVAILFHGFLPPSFAFRSMIPILLKRLYLQPIKFTSTYVIFSRPALRASWVS